MPQFTEAESFLIFVSAILLIAFILVCVRLYETRVKYWDLTEQMKTGTNAALDKVENALDSFGKKMSAMVDEDGPFIPFNRQHTILLVMDNRIEKQFHRYLEELYQEYRHDTEQLTKLLSVITLFSVYAVPVNPDVEKCLVPASFYQLPGAATRNVGWCASVWLNQYQVENGHVSCNTAPTSFAKFGFYGMSIQDVSEIINYVKPVDFGQLKPVLWFDVPWFKLVTATAYTFQQMSEIETFLHSLLSNDKHLEELCEGSVVRTDLIDPPDKTPRFQFDPEWLASRGGAADAVNG